MFDRFEANYQAPAPAELEGAVLNVTDDGRTPAAGQERAEAMP